MAVSPPPPLLRRVNLKARFVGAAKRLSQLECHARRQSSARLPRSTSCQRSQTLPLPLKPQDVSSRISEAGLFLFAPFCQEGQGWKNHRKKQRHPCAFRQPTLEQSCVPCQFRAWLVVKRGERLGRGGEDGGGWEPSSTQDEDPDVYDGQDFSREWCPGGRTCGRIRHFFNQAVLGVH
jgi:hypothetical protein